jgi:hypothetical protein
MRIAIVAVLFVALPALAADDKPEVREIPTKDLKITFPDKPGGVTNPETIATAEALAKSPVLKNAADELKKKVDFDKEKLLLFTWQGSGGDKLAGALATADKKTLATFTYTPGLTRDLRQHVKLFAVPKDAEVKVVTGK